MYISDELEKISSDLDKEKELLTSIQIWENIF